MKELQGTEMKGGDWRQKLKKKKSIRLGENWGKEFPRVLRENPGWNRVEVTGESSRSKAEPLNSESILWTVELFAPEFYLLINKNTIY